MICFILRVSIYVLKMLLDFYRHARHIETDYVCLFVCVGYHSGKGLEGADEIGKGD